MMMTSCAWRGLPLALIAGLVACGGAGDEPAGSTVPSDVPSLVRQEYLRYTAPPAGYRAGLAWLTTIHDERSLEPSRIDVDWLRLYCRNATDTRVVTSYEYDDGRFEGGLWQRRPRWFESGYAGLLPHVFDREAGSVSFMPSSSPSLVWHLWTPRGDLPRQLPNVDRCWMQARVRVTGAALVQGGVDYYEAVNAGAPLEAGVSNWAFAGPQWQIIALGAP